MATIFRRNIDITAGTADPERFNQVWFWFMEDLIAQGWQVLGSGDGFTFENQGQTGGGSGTGSGGGYHLFTQAPAIQTPSSWIANAWSNVNGFPNNLGASWIRMAPPADSGNTREFIFQLQWAANQGTGHTVMIATSRPGVTFSSGATAWRSPDPVGGVAISLAEIDSRYDPDAAVNRANAMVPNVAAAVVHWVIGDATRDYDFMIYSNRTNGVGNLFGAFGMLRLTDANPLGTDSDPYLIIATLESSGGNTSDDFAGGQPFLRAQDTSPNPARFEDRTGGSSGQSDTLYATYGLGDADAIAANLDGHYSVCALPLSSQDGGGVDRISIQNGNDFELAKGKRMVLPDIAIGRFGDAAAGVDHRFFKGYVKNDILRWALPSQQPPKVIQKLGDPDSARLNWTNFSILWGDPYHNIKLS